MRVTTVPPEPVEPLIQIELTRREAKVLWAICGAVTGSSEGPRGVSSRIFDSLEAIEIRAKVPGGNVELPDTWEEFEK